MKAFSLCLVVLAAIVGAARADEVGIRTALQAKYDSADKAMGAGDLKAIGEMCDRGRFVAIDLQKQRRSFAKALAAFEKLKGSECKTVVESADTFQGMAKASITVLNTTTATEKGKSITIKTIKTQVDTWELSGDDWKLVESRLTSNLVTRDGKVVVNEREQVLNDWERQYGRQSSRQSSRQTSHRRHAPNGRRS